ncbi:MAG TPA: TraB/GumN family protein, partial [Piscinibacter sp.]|nr:TraB/GumN family protein [Piscinibacter sp.]
MHSFRHARRLLAAALTAWPLLAAAQDDCPPPPAPPSAEALVQAQGAARDRGFLWRLEKDG